MTTSLTESVDIAASNRRSALSIDHDIDHDSSGSSSSSSSSSSNDSISNRLLQSSSPMLPRINLVGSGDVRQLGVAPQLQPFVKLYLGLSYGDYYDTLCR